MNFNKLNLKESDAKDARYKWWLITKNLGKIQPDEWKEHCVKLKPTYFIGQLEKGDEGTYHIQALLYYDSPQRNNFWAGKGCWSKGILLKDVPKVRAYVSKNETRVEGPVEFGIEPKRISGTKDYSGALALVKERRTLEVDADILIPHFTNLKKLEHEFSQGIATKELRGRWYYGKPGTGKSRAAFEDFPDAFRKAQNKWWDGYGGQKVVILDDLDQQGACLGHLLKIWTDHYPCSGEIKGGTVALAHEIFIVTSNYLPEDIWSDQVLATAIRRRFTFKHFGINEDYEVLLRDFINSK